MLHVNFTIDNLCYINYSSRHAQQHVAQQEAQHVEQHGAPPGPHLRAATVEPCAHHAITQRPFLRRSRAPARRLQSIDHRPRRLWALHPSGRAGRHCRAARRADRATLAGRASRLASEVLVTCHTTRTEQRNTNAPVARSRRTNPTSPRAEVVTGIGAGSLAGLYAQFAVPATHHPRLPRYAADTQE
jgi:hypothetical protein